MKFNRSFKMYRCNFFLLLTIVFLFISVYSQEEVIELFVGQQRTISVAGAEQIAIAGGGKIATGSLVSDGGSIILTGKEPGVVTLTINYRNGARSVKTLRVIGRDSEMALNEILALTMGYRNFKVRKVGDNVEIRGELQTLQEKEQLQKILEKYPNVINFVNDAREKVMIQMDVRIVEVALSEDANMGIDWFAETNVSPTTKGNVKYGALSTSAQSIRLGETDVPGEVFPKPKYALGPIARLNPITARINFLVNKGKASVLAKPSLVCKSGGRAEFLAGGEFPVSVSTQDKIEVKWHSYGTGLEVNPVLHEIGKSEITVNIKVKVSELDWANAVNGYPAVSSREVSTNVDLVEGNMLALAGIISKKKARTQRRLPLLGAIPVLGRLFSSTRDEEKTSEMVILVTPYIVTSKDKDNIKLESKDPFMKKQEQKK
ncbi:MAG: pilus assembly protein N-terminal domain-containing protein [Elusimicrobiota bacterium]